jgi:RimJ/RimL family protein N-acetyltransferase
MNIEYRMFNGAKDWGWCNQQVGIKRCEDTNGIMAIDAGTDTPIGACIMDNWTANSVQCHFMLTNPVALKHKFLELCFEYMFIVEGVERVYGLVPANNEKAVKFNTHIGFTEKARMEEAYEKGVDYLLMELKQENCLHLPKQKKAA